MVLGLAGLCAASSLPHDFVAPGVKILANDAVVESDWENDHCTTIIAGKDVCASALIIFARPFGLAVAISRLRGALGSLSLLIVNDMLGLRNWSLRIKNMTITKLNGPLIRHACRRPSSARP